MLLLLMVGILHRSIDIFVYAIYIFLLLPAVWFWLMRLEAFMATKSFMILGKRYQSDFFHTDPACQIQKLSTKWWWDRFTLDYSDVREHEAWIIYELWCLLVQDLWLRVGIQVSKELTIRSLLVTSQNIGRPCI